MNVVFRVDSTTRMGGGHVMRCLALAEALASRSAICLFIVRDRPGHLADVIQRQGFPVVMLAACEENDTWLGCDSARDASDTISALGAGVDWIVVDHYGIDASWHSAVKQEAGRLMAIDDLADRPLDCDVLLDQNHGRTGEDYTELVPTRCRLLLGARYALLRPEFASTRPGSLVRRIRGTIGRILVTLGTMDSDNVTTAVLHALRGCVEPGAVIIDVVLGRNAPHLEEVQAVVSDMPVETTLHVDTPRMASLMAHADLAIGAAGTTSWERCTLGLPTLALVLAENQRFIANSLADSGAVMLMDSVEQLPTRLWTLMTQPGKLVDMSVQAREICDGQGAARVAEFMVGK